LSMSSVAKAAKSPFSGLLERICDELIVETRTMKNDQRVTHAVHVNQRGAALRVLCGTAPV
jgi:hypothetical protein